MGIVNILSELKNKVLDAVTYDMQSRNVELLKQNCEALETRLKQMEEFQETDTRDQQIQRLKEEKQKIVARLSKTNSAMKLLIDCIRIEYPDSARTIRKWQDRYRIAVKEDLHKKPIRDDVFVGRSGLHCSHADLQKFLKFGFVSFDNSTRLITITRKGHLIGSPTTGTEIPDL